MKVNEKAFKLWVLKYGMYVEVLEPSSLGKCINEAIMQMGKRYEI